MAERLEPMPCPGCGGCVCVVQLDCPGPERDQFRVNCVAFPKHVPCWYGPVRPTRDDAVITWNAVTVRVEQGRLHLAKGDSDAEA